MTEQRLIQYMENRKSPVTYELISKHFCITRSSAQTAIKKLEGAGRVQFTFGENGKKLWQLIDKAPDSVAFPSVRIHRIANSTEAAPVKSGTTAPTRKQSWLSSIE